MAPLNFLNLLAAATLAVIALSYSPAPVVALSPDSHGQIFARRGVHHGMRREPASHKKRSNSKRCKVRESSSLVSSSTVSSYTPVSTSSTTPYVAPATSSTSSSSVAATTPASSSSNSGVWTGPKGGLAWPNGDTGKLTNWKTNHMSYLYTWGSDPLPAASNAGFQVLPQLWGDKDTATFAQNIGSYTTPTYVLAFNEPNESGQSNMTPDHAVQLWWQYIEPQKANGHKLVAPAVSSSPVGFTWTQEFFAKCVGCTIDAIATHYYDVSASDFIAYQNKFHDTFQLPILVTEYACQNFNNGPQCSSDQIWSFMTDTTAWMDSTDWIISYMWFGAMLDMYNVNYECQLMGSDGLPNTLGYRFINGH
ncbi:glycosyl hydrolase catalytic core-domain-containing protein [Armillaria mellea]|nr:glycosyl hydrolase catalytic core-domain-containing protein [Armillaria mellea]